MVATTLSIRRRWSHAGGIGVARLPPRRLSVEHVARWVALSTTFMAVAWNTNLCRSLISTVRQELPDALIVSALMTTGLPDPLVSIERHSRSRRRPLREDVASAVHADASHDAEICDIVEPSECQGCRFATIRWQTPAE